MIVQSTSESFQENNVGRPAFRASSGSGILPAVPADATAGKTLVAQTFRGAGAGAVAEEETGELGMMVGFMRYR